MATHLLLDWTTVYGEPILFRLKDGDSVLDWTAVYGEPYMQGIPEQSGSGAQNVSPGFASRTASGHSPTLHQQVRLDPALRTAAGYTPTIKQTLALGIASRTASGYEPSFSTSVTLALGFASRTASGYDPSLHQQVRPGFALRTPTGWSPAIDDGAQEFAAGFAERTAAAYPIGLNQTIVVSAALRTSTGYTPRTIGGGGGADPAAVWDGYILENGETPGDVLRLIRAVLVGKATVPAGAGSYAFRDAADSKDRVAGTIAADARTPVTVDGT